MNHAVTVASDGLLTTADLAARRDFTLGLAHVSPSARSIAGPGGTADVEPRVMQVLVVLAEHAGQVVTRDMLFRRCWGGVYVGDDSLNRAIAAVRKLAADVAAGSFEIETVPRTGYRLIGERKDLASEDRASVGSEARMLTRRELAGGGLVLIAAGGIGSWAFVRWRTDSEYEALLRTGAEIIHNSNEADPEKSRRALERAVLLRPGSAPAWGLLAYAKSMIALNAPASQALGKVEEAKATALKALALDPKEPNALLAMVELEGSTVDWFTRDRRLRQVLAIDPGNAAAMGELVLLLQAAGMSQESWAWNERAIAADPLSLEFLGRRALKLWIFGRLSESDKVADQLVDLYPSAPRVYFIRFSIYALSGRARAARALLDSHRDLFEVPTAEFWSACLPALDRPTRSAVANARQACFAASAASAELATHAVMILSALGQIDDAFDVARGFLLSRGRIVRRGKSTLGTDSLFRINTQWLFTPPCAPMREDARFLPLCDGVGLVDYWRRRGVKPDYQLGRP